MKKHDIDIIKEALNVLIEQPLRSLNRAGTLVVMNFGEFAESDVPVHDKCGKFLRDENNRIVYEKGMVGKFAINTTCSMRLTCGDEILFSNGDIMLPNTRLANSSDFDWDTFDCSIIGNNYFDEMVAKYFGNELLKFIVKKIDVSKFGDLKVSLNDGFTLELFADGSGMSNNWCFYDITSNKNHLTVTGNGVLLDEINEHEDAKD